MAGMEIVKYESAFGMVELTAEDVKKYLVRGGGTVTDQEIKLFMELCKYQRLNPFVGEAYPIKFGSDFQMVVGYEAYKRRAEENPAYRGRKSGIIVLRGQEIVKKEGTCLYPTESVIGGWCCVYRIRHDEIEETFKEVGFKEYDKGQANWKTKPCMMIEKVAVSQALRAAFPKDYAGLYIAEEVAPVIELDPEKDDPAITQEQRQALFSAAKSKFGKDKWKDEFQTLLASCGGLTSTTGMKLSQYETVMKAVVEAEAPQRDAKPDPTPDASMLRPEDQAAEDTVDQYPSPKDGK